MKDNEIKNLIEKVTINYYKSVNNNDLITPRHTKFICEAWNGKISHIFTYQCNLKYTKINKNVLLACLLSDASSYNDCVVGDEEDNIQEFANMFGYDNIEELLKTYKECKKTNEFLNKIYTEEEQHKLYNYFEEKGII